MIDKFDTSLIGKRIGIFGKGGSGKSTVVDVCMLRQTIPAYTNLCLDKFEFFRSVF